MMGSLTSREKQIMCLKLRASIILSIMAALPSAADIYRCQLEDGKWLYTDGQCNSAAGQIVNLAPVVTFSKLQPANLSNAEHRALIDLDARIAVSRDIRLRQHKRASRRIKKYNKIKQQNCTRAQRDRAKIRDKRRHGYKASEARNLAHQVRNLERIIKADCL